MVAPFTASLFTASPCFCGSTAGEEVFNREEVLRKNKSKWRI